MITTLEQCCLSAKSILWPSTTSNEHQPFGETIDNNQDHSNPSLSSCLRLIPLPFFIILILAVSRLCLDIGGALRLRTGVFGMLWSTTYFSYYHFLPLFSFLILSLSFLFFFFFFPLSLSLIITFPLIVFLHSYNDRMESEQGKEGEGVLLCMGCAYSLKL